MSSKLMLKRFLLSACIGLLSASGGSALTTAQEAAPPSEQSGNPSSTESQAGTRPPAEGSRERPSGWLGIILDMEAGQQQPAGARVIHVFPGSPADRAGLRPGDLVLELGGKKIATAGQLANELRSLKAGTKIELSVDRNGQLWGVSTALAGQAFLYHDHHRSHWPLYEPDGWHQVSGAPKPTEYKRLDEQQRRMDRLMQQMLDEIDSLREEVEELKKRVNSNNERPVEPTGGALIDSS